MTHLDRFTFPTLSHVDKFGLESMLPADFTVMKWPSIQSYTTYSTTPLYHEQLLQVLDIYPNLRYFILYIDHEPNDQLYNQRLLKAVREIARQCHALQEINVISSTLWGGSRVQVVEW